MMTFLKQFGWMVPTGALAVGAVALLSGVSASSTTTDLPAVEVAATATATTGSADVLVDGENWDAMRKRMRDPNAPRNAVSLPSMRPGRGNRPGGFTTPSGNVIVPGVGTLPGTGPNERQDLGTGQSL